MSEHWERLVAVAMLGTDRRNPPDAPPAIAALVDDTLRTTPAERMLAQVAAMVAVRRAGVMPASPAAPLAGPPTDERPEIPPTAIERWYDITTRWPVLVDEWMIAVIDGGWRVVSQLVPDLLARHRGDRVRRLRAHLACGPLAAWLVEQLPELADATERGGVAAVTEVDADELMRLADLPVPPDLVALVDAGGAHAGVALAEAVAAGKLAHPHRAVLVNLLARIDPAALGDIHRALAAVDPAARGAALAATLADLAATRHAMLADLTPPK